MVVWGDFNVIGRQEEKTMTTLTSYMASNFQCDHEKFGSKRMSYVRKAIQICQQKRKPHIREAR
jgi:hypothetical protein